VTERGGKRGGGDESTLLLKKTLREEHKKGYKKKEGPHGLKKRQKTEESEKAHLRGTGSERKKQRS